MDPMTNKDSEKICVLYAALDLHSSHDFNTLTRELFKVPKRGQKSIPIRDIDEIVNDSWISRDIEQSCTNSMVKRKGNWRNYKVPLGTTNEDKNQVDETYGEGETKIRNRQESTSSTSSSLPPTPTQDIDMFFEALKTTNQKIDKNTENIEDIRKYVMKTDYMITSQSKD